MALSDLVVFQETVQTTATEVQSQAVDKFNAASNGGLILTTRGHSGDFSESTMWAKIQGLVRRRNPYGSGQQTAKNLNQLLNVSVKVAAGTPPISIDPGMFKWIQKSPEEAGVVIGKQMAEDTVADMLNTGIMSYIAAISPITTNVHDISATAVVSLSALNKAASLFGDRSQDINSWVMHSKSLTDIHQEALTNKNQLFQFGTVTVYSDGFGRPIVVTDSPFLAQDPKYYTLGLSAGAVIVEQGNEYTDNIDTKNGDENIQRTFQAEWTYQVGLKGISWDTTTGGKAPNDSALASSANWERFATSHKDLAGVLLISK